MLSPEELSSHEALSLMPKSSPPTSEEGCCCAVVSTGGGVCVPALGGVALLLVKWLNNRSEERRVGKECAD